MTYALLLWPNNNQRYEEAALNPARAELDIILKACGVQAECEYRSLMGAGALVFEADEIGRAHV